jgi:hypothetical protein
VICEPGNPCFLIGIWCSGSFIVQKQVSAEVDAVQSRLAGDQRGISWSEVLRKLTLQLLFLHLLSF